MPQASANPVVHLELRTHNLPRACDFYTRLFGWRADTVQLESGSYLTLDLGDRLQGGVTEIETEHPLWLPYVEVTDLAAAIERAVGLGASVALEPREGPAGWRSVITAPAGGAIALWQPKSRSDEPRRPRRS